MSKEIKVSSITIPVYMKRYCEIDPKVKTEVDEFIDYLTNGCVVSKELETEEHWKVFIFAGTINMFPMSSYLQDKQQYYLHSYFKKYTKDDIDHEYYTIDFSINNIINHDYMMILDYGYDYIKFRSIIS